MVNMYLGRYIVTCKEPREFFYKRIICPCKIIHVKRSQICVNCVLFIEKTVMLCRVFCRNSKSSMLVCSSEHSRSLSLLYFMLACQCASALANSAGTLPSKTGKLSGIEKEEKKKVG